MMKWVKRLIPAVVLGILILLYSIWTRNLLQKEYDKADSYLSNENYSQAYDTFEKLGDYADSKDRALELKYTMALEYKNDEKYEEAEKIFEELKLYKDSEEQAELCRKSIENAKNDLYVQAQQLYNEEKYNEAAIAFSALGNYKDSIDISKKAKERSVRLSNAHTFDTCAGYAVGINNGKVEICGKHGDFDSERWNKESIISVAAGGWVVAGLTIDGDVIIEDWTESYDLKQAETWKDIIDITVGNEFVFGIDSKNELHAVGRNLEHECETSRWDDYKIVNVEAGWRHIAGLDENGNVHVLEKANSDGILVMQKQIDENPEKWSNVIDIAAGGGEGKDIGGEFGHVVGLREDGEVVAAGNNNEGQCDIPSNDVWKNAKKIAAGDHHTVIISSDDKIYTIGDDGTIDYDGQPKYEKMETWDNLIDIAAGSHFTLAVDKEGNVHAAGYDHQHQDEARKWNSIKVYLPK